MTLREYIRKNRAAIDARILRTCPNLRSLNDEDRANWIMNDERLYMLALSQGVKVS